MTGNDDESIKAKSTPEKKANLRNLITTMKSTYPLSSHDFGLILIPNGLGPLFRGPLFRESATGIFLHPLMGQVYTLGLQYHTPVSHICRIYMFWIHVHIRGICEIVVTNYLRQIFYDL